MVRSDRIGVRKVAAKDDRTIGRRPDAVIYDDLRSKEERNLFLPKNR